MDEPGTAGRADDDVVRAELLLAGRFRLDVRLAETAGVSVWRAVDEVLSRYVAVHTLPRDDVRTPRLVVAAQAAATAGDHRFLRVLDASEQDGIAYVVREWATARDVATLLADGPFDHEQAVAICTEVAEALARADEQGLHHQCLDPTCVLVTDEGAVRVIGLQTEAVIRGRGHPDPARADARALGALLYATLTGRWPGRPSHGLRAAPQVDGHLASPRQVLAGIPRSLDEIVDRALGDPPRHRASSLRTPAEVATALRATHPEGLRVRALAPVVGGTNAGVRLPPALVHDPPVPHQPALLAAPRALAPAAEAPARHPTRGRGLARVGGVLVATALLVGATLLGLQLLLSAIRSGGTPDTPASSSTAPTPLDPAALAVAAAYDFDPSPGNGSENTRQVANAIDANVSTMWRTSTYYDPLERQKPGVGLSLDLGKPQPVSRVHVLLDGTPYGLELRAAPDQTGTAPAALDGWTTVASRTSAGGQVELTLTEPVTTRWLLVWLTSLPTEDGNWRGGIASIDVLGPAGAS